MKELLDIYYKNFPNNIRSKEKVKEILNNSNNHIIENRIDNKLIGVSIINKNTIIMLCVDKDYRHKGLGTKLLNQSEKYILDQGFNKVNVGVGYDYLESHIFYPKHGYVEYKELYMKKDLGNS